MRPPGYQSWLEHVVRILQEQKAFFAPPLYTGRPGSSSRIIDLSPKQTREDSSQFHHQIRQHRFLSTYGQAAADCSGQVIPDTLLRVFS